MSRIKSNYESRNRHFLTRKVPVIIRLDGKAFHTYTRGLTKPFDEGLINDMQQTTIYLCENIQGVKCGYTQSDEISLLLTDYDDLQTQAWFDYNQSKMESISASLATGIFNQLRTRRNLLGNIKEAELKADLDKQINSQSNVGEKGRNKSLAIKTMIDSFNNVELANFDSRGFNIPKEDTANYFYARQKDAVKNSIAMLAQSLYSHKELHGKNGSDMQEMCFQKGHNYNDLHWSKKRGSFVVKNTYVDGKLCDNKQQLDFIESINSVGGKYVVRNKWEVVETPMKFDDEVFRQWL